MYGESEVAGAAYEGAVVGRAEGVEGPLFQEGESDGVAGRVGGGHNKDTVVVVVVVVVVVAADGGEDGRGESRCFAGACKIFFFFNLNLNFCTFLCEILKILNFASQIFERK